MKICCGCNVSKDYSCFSKYKNSRDGLKPRCKSCLSAEGKVYSSENRDHINAYQKQWLKDNPDKYIAKRDKSKKHRDTYKQNNKHKSRLYTANRRAAILKATPSWQTQEEKDKIAELYKKAQDIATLTGVKQHIDHIEPLLGKHSRGLHILINLRIIPEKENLSKGNKLITN